MGRYGYQLLETPLIEPADLFLTKAGDQIIKKLFTFERQGQELALRPEFTASAAYYYLSSPESPSYVARWQFNGPIFEDDPSDFQHSPQRFSIGAELIGLRGPLADAEITGMAMHGLRTLEIQDTLLLIGHAGLTRQGLARFNLDSRTERFLLTHLTALKEKGISYVEDLLEATLYTSNMQYEAASELPDSDNESQIRQVLNALLNSSHPGAAMGGRTLEDIAQRLLRKRKRAAERVQIKAALEWLHRWVQINSHPDEAFPAIEVMVGLGQTARQTLDEWRTVIELLMAYNIQVDHIWIQPALARSWEYYTGIVFELRTSEDVHLGGGGRYDELARLIGGKYDVPAVGFAYYVDNMLTTLPSHQPVNNRPVVFVYASVMNLIPATRLAYQLRLRAQTVILSSEPQVAHTRAIYINDGGSARFGGNSYALSQVDSLLNDLNKIKNDE